MSHTITTFLFTTLQPRGKATRCRGFRQMRSISSAYIRENICRCMQACPPSIFPYVRGFYAALGSMHAQKDHTSIYLHGLHLHSLLQKAILLPSFKAVNISHRYNTNSACTCGKLIPSYKRCLSSSLFSLIH